MRIFIDPGHGGTDPGAVNTTTGLRESTVNLDTALILGPILQEMGHAVRYSRTTDTNVSLSARARMANDWPAELFISIHCNSVSNPSANGTETICYRTQTRAEQLAKDVQAALIAANGLRDRGVKTMNLAVLRLTRMPAILVELAFISNMREAELLGQRSFREKCAYGIAEGVRRYVSR